MEMTRRTALLTSAAIAANVANPLRAFAQETPRKGGVFTVHYGAEQRQLNPSLQASTGVYIIGGKIQERWSISTPGQPVGVLAESWEATPDGKTITFKLRKGVTWHDGKPFTSADVAVHRHGHVEEDPQLRHDAAALPRPPSKRRTR
jgi:peptide/nickel transport system substrate-binding protein